MSITARRVHHTYEEYVALEDASTVRHEYDDGEIYAMAGGSPDHAALAATVIALLQTHLPSAAASIRPICASASTEPGSRPTRMRRS